MRQWWRMMTPEEGWMDGRDNGKRRMSSFHSSVSLDVTLHLFISFLNVGSKEEGGRARVWNRKNQVTLNLEHHVTPQHIRLIVLCCKTDVKRVLICINISHLFWGKRGELRLMLAVSCTILWIDWYRFYFHTKHSLWWKKNLMKLYVSVKW